MSHPLPLLGESPAIQRVRERIRTAAKTSHAILITGPSGSGKQAAAEWIHQHSARSSQRFVEANTACWNNLATLQSTLFGHEKGSFTGAGNRRKGLFEQADRGTLFLDEIGELGLEAQPMLLKALDRGMIEPLGADRSRRVDVRLVVATNRDLEAEVRENRFRQDLMARISPLQIRMPPLSERIEDLEALWNAICRKHGIEVPIPETLGEEATCGDYPDNLRGLERRAIEISVWGDQ
ncbi:MAG: sigma-54 factor interaction domain-containing protein [Candidatus Omnitrophica bacterium]|nr:sigma-54 factor interaction domain-containing protein [Candidatus Omnitrophota bacterium]